MDNSHASTSVISGPDIPVIPPVGIVKPPRKQIGDYLRGEALKLMKRNGWSRNKLAQAIGVHRSNMTVFFRREIDAGTKIEAGLIRLLGLTYDGLYAAVSEREHARKTKRAEQRRARREAKKAAAISTVEAA